MQLNGFKLRSDKCRLKIRIFAKNIGLLDPVAPLNMLGHGLLDLASRGVPFYMEHSIVPIPQGDFGCMSHKSKINIKVLLDRPTAIVKGGLTGKITTWWWSLWSSCRSCDRWRGGYRGCCCCCVHCCVRAAILMVVTVFIVVVVIAAVAAGLVVALVVTVVSAIRWWWCSK